MVVKLEKQIEVLEKVNDEFETTRHNLPKSKQIPLICDEFQAEIDYAIDNLKLIIKRLKLIDKEKK